MPKVDPALRKTLKNCEKCLVRLADIIKNPRLSSKLPHPRKLNECIMKFCELDDMGKNLICSALNARQKAYCPYSKFKVGAAFETKCGLIYSGCNVENVAYSPTCCAERTALATAISEGHTKFVAGAIVAFHKDGFITPCGPCRQFIVEFAQNDIRLYVAIARDNQKRMIEDEDEVLVTSIYNLLPYSFTAY